MSQTRVVVAVVGRETGPSDELGGATLFEVVIMKEMSDDLIPCCSSSASHPSGGYSCAKLAQNAHFVSELVNAVRHKEGYLNENFWSSGP